MFCRWRQQPALLAFSLILPEQYGLKATTGIHFPHLLTSINYT